VATYFWFVIAMLFSDSQITFTEN